MIEAKLHIKLTTLSNNINPFYGKTTREKEINETHTWEKDERENIAPFGIKGSISIERLGGRTDIFDFNINNHYFEEDALPNTYHCVFDIDCQVYELCFSVVDDQIDELTLCEWGDYGNFQDGEEPDHYYHKEKFTTYFKMYL